MCTQNPTQWEPETWAKNQELLEKNYRKPEYFNVIYIVSNHGI